RAAPEPLRLRGPPHPRPRRGAGRHGRGARRARPPRRRPPRRAAGGGRARARRRGVVAAVGALRRPRDGGGLHGRPPPRPRPIARLAPLRHQTDESMRPTAPLRLAALAVLLAAGLPVQAQNWLWVLGSGSPAADEGNSVAVDAAGNVYVTGYFTGAITLGSFTLTSPGPDQEFYLVKLSPEGDVLWARSGGGVSDDVGYGLAVDAAGDVYVSGRLQETATFGDTTLVSAGGWDFFLARYSPEGDLRWVRSAGGAEDDEGFGLAVGPDGAAYATGLFFDTATFGDTTLVSAGGRDIFAVKYSPEGDVVWARNGGGPDNDVGYGIAVDADGAAYVCGRFWDTATFGDVTLTSAGHYDVFLVKYSPEGDVLWADRGGSTGGERAYAVTVDGSDVYLVGRFARTATFGPLTLTSEGGQDVFLVKYTSDGHALWGRRGGGATDDVSRAVVVD